ncbi:hypothetical protein D3C77_814130 [compost metagenome]
MKSVVPTKMPHLSLKLRISRKCNVGPFADVVRKISEVVNMPQIVPVNSEAHQGM